MKKYLLGVVAIALALGLNAFTRPEKKAAKFQETYWFLVDQSDISSGNVTQSDVTFLEKNSGSEPVTSCSGTANYCLIAFTDPSKVKEMPLNSGNFVINGSQAPDDVAARRQ